MKSMLTSLKSSTKTKEDSKEDKTPPTTKKEPLKNDTEKNIEPNKNLEPSIVLVESFETAVVEQVPSTTPPIAAPSNFKPLTIKPPISGKILVPNKSKSQLGEFTGFSIGNSPLSQRLFYKGNVIDEDDETTDFVSRAESPLIFKSPYYIRPVTPVLNRVNTYTSVSQYSVGNRQDSKRFRPGAVRKVRRRAVFKNGDCNILHSRISKRRLRFLQDIFTTLVDAQWRWTLLVFALSFLLSWLGFAVIWWLIAFTHGDFEDGHLPGQSDDYAPCVSQIYSFTSCFLFSIETQHTIGYGSRATSEECPEAIFVMCLQSITGVMIQAFMVGIVFAKMTRPKHRTQTLLFSRNAVICQRDSSLCLMFRVGDMRKSHIIGASIRAQLIRPRSTKEGEILTQFQTELAVNADGCDGNLFFIWPMTIVHKIDQDSPLYNLSAQDMLQDRFEIVVILEGTIESTGQTTQARSSYVPSEVLWGHRFEPVVSYNKDRQGYEVNYSKFDSTLQVDTPLCSGAELAEFYKLQEPVGHQELSYPMGQNYLMNMKYAGIIMSNTPQLDYLNVDSDTERENFRVRPPTPIPNEAKNQTIILASSDDESPEGRETSV